jgi:hypothetical protein
VGLVSVYRYNENKPALDIECHPFDLKYYASLQIFFELSFEELMVQCVQAFTPPKNIFRL